MLAVCQIQAIVSLAFIFVRSHYTHWRKLQPFQWTFQFKQFLSWFILILVMTKRFISFSSLNFLHVSRFISDIFISMLSPIFWNWFFPQPLESSMRFSIIFPALESISSNSEFFLYVVSMLLQPMSNQSPQPELFIIFRTTICLLSALYHNYLIY